jgi:hypothetical protein
MFSYLLILFSFFTNNVAFQPQTFYQDNELIGYSFHMELDSFVKIWHEEASKGFEKPIIVICHGQGKYYWYATPSERRGCIMFTEYMANWVVNKHPKRNIILVVCNPGGLELNIPNVYYFDDEVWTVPDGHMSKPEWIEWDKKQEAFAVANDQKRTPRETIPFNKTDGSIQEVLGYQPYQQRKNNNGTTHPTGRIQ